MKVATCNSYAARPAGAVMWRDGKSAFKVYYVDIYGRRQPQRFEWALHRLGLDVVPRELARQKLEGIGFVLAFPHIVKVFRWAPSAEILLFVRAFETGNGSNISLDREEGYVEFACLAEAVVAAEEYRLWAAADSVEAYLDQWADWGDLPIADHGKLGRYWSA